MLSLPLRTPLRTVDWLIWLVECVNAQPTGTLSLEPKASTSTPFRYLFNDFLPLKHDRVGRILNCLLHLVLSTELTTCQVLSKHLPGELQNEESAEGMWSREAAIF